MSTKAPAHEIIGLTVLGLIALAPLLIMIPPGEAYDGFIGVLEYFDVGLIFILGEIWGLLYWRSRKIRPALLAFCFVSAAFLFSFGALLSLLRS